MSTPEELARLIEEVSGNLVPEREIDRTARVATELAVAEGFGSLERYLAHLSADRSGSAWRHLLAAITVKESFLFRGSAQFSSLREVVIPALVRARGPRRRLRLWSAGCARGEEAASLAVVLASCEELAGWDWRIAATDVDGAALEEARVGRYGPRAVSRVPEGLLRAHMRRSADGFQLRRELLERIDYRLLNLATEPMPVPDGAPFDLVFLRNVLIYFREPSQRRVVRTVACCMAADGYLFLGPSESLLGLSTDLVPVELSGCFCYRRRPADVPDRTREGSPPLFGPADSIAREGAGHGLPAPSAPPRPREAFDHVVRAVLAALLEGRPEVAVGLLATAQEYRPEDAVLRAMEGLAQDRCGDADGAIRAFRAALYLDPALFQARLALADCLDRLGLSDRAARERSLVVATVARGEFRELPGAGDLGLPAADEVLRLSDGPGRP